MPELPEVEALRRSLIPWIIGQKVNLVKVSLPKLVTSSGTKRESSNQKAQEFEQKITNKTITKINRRAKNLLFEFQDCSLMLVHLKMTGQLVFAPKEKRKTQKQTIIAGGHPIQESEVKLPHKHTYVNFELSNGTLYYNDVRQFGYLLYYDSRETFEKDNHFTGLGFEPLEDFDFEDFYRLMKARQSPIKKIFLDQSVVVGLGNIYADEVAFYAGVRPTRRGKSLTKKELQKLYEGIKTILPRAVDLGGSSVANYLLADGSRGNYAKEHMVYNRGGKPCYKCGRTLKKIQLAGRTTVYCTHDQK